MGKTSANDLKTIGDRHISWTSESHRHQRPIVGGSLPPFLLKAIFFATCFFVSCFWAGSVVAQNVPRLDDKALFKLLVNGKETIRFQGLAYLQVQPQRKFDSLSTLTRAAEKQIERLKDKKIPPPSTVALLVAIGSTGTDEAAAFLSSQLSSKNGELVLLVCDIAKEHQIRQMTDHLSAMRETEIYEQNYPLRAAIAKALNAMETPEADKTLVAIRSQSDGQLRHDINQWLQTRGIESAQPEKGKANFGFQSPSADSEFKLASDASSNELTFSKPEYYGLKLQAKRVLFLLDHSGSMKKRDEEATTRLDRAKAELIYTIQSLPSDYKFSVLIFSTKTRFWQNQLLVANDKNKRKAIEFVKRIGYGNLTNTHSALAISLNFDSDLEAIYLLSDGRPTQGSIINPAMIVKDITMRNRFRHLKYHTIGFAVNGITAQFLKTLADQNGGEYREVK